ncbi:hypothetical protein NPIL_516701 [Nephila pilipes]|uniref:Uncharacterized protein n=1 Tax=Nephila pilipes TaxID=299642 RepID=A0A8X6QUB0_NEPPI|nr:hypothetical protein NPIL_516701 [Nephila pilipes]
MIYPHPTSVMWDKEGKKIVASPVDAQEGEEHHPRDGCGGLPVEMSLVALRATRERNRWGRDRTGMEGHLYTDVSCGLRKCSICMPLKLSKRNATWGSNSSLHMRTSSFPRDPQLVKNNYRPTHTEKTH